MINGFLDASNQPRAVGDQFQPKEREFTHQVLFPYFECFQVILFVVQSRQSFLPFSLTNDARVRT
jgi:hypothetical protein